MFAPDPRLTHVPASREQIVAVFGSMNKPHVAIPGRGAQEVMAWVVGAATGSGRYVLYVYLLPLRALQPVVYLDQERPLVTAEEYPDAEADALAFVEGMGFIVEPLNFRSLSVDQQDLLMHRLPCFSRDPRPLAAAAPRGDDGANPPSQQRLGRLLAAF